MAQQKIYFPNLNGLRFIAASLVIIHHIEQIKSFFNIENYWNSVPFIQIAGKLGVVLFFVLSGFLITYLMLAEEHSFKKISIKKFYLRRILRIWPLYFLIISLAFLVLPHINLFTLPHYGKEVVYANLSLKLCLYAMFFPNIVLLLLGMVPYASHTWSIGIEEQFYLVWPIFLKYLKKYRLLLMSGIIIIYLGIRYILATSYTNFLPHKDIIRAFWSTFNFDSMAIGGIFAILLFQKSNILKLLQNNFSFYASMAIVIILMGNGIYMFYELYSVLFGIIILNFASNNHIKISLEHQFLNYLGNISYGLYMYHPIAIVLALSIIKGLHLVTNWLLYPLSFILTIAIAALSYKYFESYFLKFKNKFSSEISAHSTNSHMK
jgi:peptidoglycan/LPS O-acetylase OafA/YrhL